MPNLCKICYRESLYWGSLKSSAGIRDLSSFHWLAWPQTFVCWIKLDYGFFLLDFQDIWVKYELAIWEIEPTTFTCKTGILLLSFDHVHIPIWLLHIMSHHIIQLLSLTSVKPHHWAISTIDECRSWIRPLLNAINFRDDLEKIFASMGNWTRIFHIWSSHLTTELAIQWIFCYLGTTRNIHNLR